MRATFLLIALAAVLVAAVPAGASVEPPLGNTTYVYLSKDRKVNAFMKTTPNGRQGVAALYCGTGTFIAETPRFTIRPDGFFDGQLKAADGSRFRLLGRVDGGKIDARIVTHGYPLCGEHNDGIAMTVGHSKPAYFQPLHPTAGRQGVIQIQCSALVNRGETVPISGDLLPAVAGSKIELTVSVPDGSAKTTVTTLDSRFATGFQVSPTAALGTGTVVASFKGDATRRGTSKTCQFHIVDGPKSP